MNISDPRLNNIFTALTDNRKDAQGNNLSLPAFSSNKYVEPDNNNDPKIPIVVSCSLDCLPEIEVVEAVPGDSVHQILNDEDLIIDLMAQVSTGTTQEKFIKLMIHLSNPFYAYHPVYATDDRFFLYVIFDDKLPVSWGELVDMGGQFVRDTDIPLRFPNTFESFTLALYSLNDDAFYLFFKIQ